MDRKLIQRKGKWRGQFSFDFFTVAHSRSSLQLLSQHRYLTPTGLSQFRPPSPISWKPYLETTSVPCYMDFYTRGSTLAVTDLGTNYYSTFFIYDDAINKYGMDSLKAWSGRRLRRATGVFVDDDGKAVVADAASRKIHIFDQSGYHVNQVDLVDENDKPYISGLFINLAGFIAVCDRKSYDGELHIYRLLPPAEDEWDCSEERKRISDQAGFFPGQLCLCFFVLQL